MRTCSCCVVNCKNTGRNSNCKFYNFPTATWKLEQRKKWINAVKRNNPDGSPWIPKRSSYICSDHFVGGKKSEEEASPSYIPTIFPSIYNKSKVNEAKALSRHERFMNRRLNQQTTPIMSSSDGLKTPQNNTVDSDFVQKVQDDKECQVNFFDDSNETGKTLVCNRYIYVNDQKCDAEIQTDIMNIKESKVIINRKKCSDNHNAKRIVNSQCKTTVIECAVVRPIGVSFVAHPANTDVTVRTVNIETEEIHLKTEPDDEYFRTDLDYMETDPTNIEEKLYG